MPRLRRRSRYGTLLTNLIDDSPELGSRAMQVKRLLELAYDGGDENFHSRRDLPVTGIDDTQALVGTAVLRQDGHQRAAGEVSRREDARQQCDAEAGEGRLMQGSRIADREGATDFDLLLDAFRPHQTPDSTARWARCRQAPMPRQFRQRSG